MKIKITIIVALFISTLSYAQFTGKKLKLADIDQLKKAGTVIVAISDDVASNEVLEKAMNAYWTASKFKIIKKSEVDTYAKTYPENYVLTYLVNNKASSFVTMNSTYSPGHSNNSPGKVTNTMTTHTTKTIGDGLILTKNFKKLKRLEPSDAMMYCFMDNLLDDIDPLAEFCRQIGAMNSILTLPTLKQEKLGGWKVATLDQKEILSKELWISEMDLNKDGKVEAKMKAAYKPYKHKIVSKEEIAKAIIDKRSDIVYLAVEEYQPGMNIFLIQSPDNNRVLFFMAGTKGFDAKSFAKIKSGKVYGN